MFYRETRWLFAITVTVLLGACAAPLKKVDLSPMAMANIKTIAVIRPPEPALYEVANFGHPAGAFGAIGGIVVVADQNKKKEQLSKVYKENGVAISNELAQRVADRLNELGFTASIEDAPWEVVDGIARLPPEKVKSKADAILIIYPASIGFVVTGPTGGYNNDYLPTVAAAISIRGKDRQQIYRGYHVTGWHLKNEGWLYTPPTKTFPNFDSLIKNPNTSSGSLIDAAAIVATSFEQDLRRQLKIKKKLSATASVTSPPLNSIDIRDPEKLSLLGIKVKDAYERFRARPLPRAFAITANGKWWIASGTKPKNPSSDKEPSLRVVSDCEAQHHTKCFLYAVDNDVVYKSEM